MAKIDYQFPVSAMHGKACKHDDLIFKKSNLSGKSYTSKICNKRTGDPTANELTSRAKFKAACDSARAIMADPDQRLVAETAFKAQTKYLTLRTYLIGKYFADNA